MLVKMQYKDGSIRFLKPLESFFQRDAKNQFDIKALTFSTKALMNDTGKCHTAEVFHGDTHLLSIEVAANAPQLMRKISKEEHIKWRAKQKDLIRKAKSELLNPQFSVVSKEGKSFELGSWKQLAA